MNGVVVGDSDQVEERFIARLRERDERAFNELVHAYEDRVFRLVFRMLGRRDEAEDMVQEVFVQVFKAVGSFRGDAKLGTWIYRIAINLCKNRGKYLSRRRASAQDELSETVEREEFQSAGGVTTGETSRPDEMIEGYQLEDILRICLVNLDQDYREVLVLRDVEELSYEEIMEITGLPEGTVKSRIHRGRIMLKDSVDRRLGGKRS